MIQSGIFGPAGNGIEYDSGYSMPEKFAETSSAVLYRVRKAGKYFIIKTPKEESGQSIALLQREYELSIGKSHPNIVSVFTYEHSTIVGPGIVMEYVDGRTLAEFLAEKPSFAQLRRVLEQLLQAVSYIHRCGLVHNDIKPDNIMVTRADNSVRLLDFGLSDNDAFYLARTLGCTPQYASPELQARSQEIDTRSDIYSLGVIMKEMFGSRYSRISARCTQHDKEKRYANADEVAKAVRRSDIRPKALFLLFAVAAVMLPILYGVYSVNAEQARITAAGNAEAEYEEKLLSGIENSVDSIGMVHYALVEKEKYYEFAYNHLAPYYTAMGEYQTGHLSSIKDSRIYSVASARYSQTYSRCLKRIVEQIESLPSIYSSGLSEEEVEFYRTLIFDGKPFVPYSPE